MNNIIETLEYGYGFPVQSHIAAVQKYNEAARAGHYAGNYGNMLRNILDIDCQELENEDHARIQVGYVIQLAVTAHNAGEKLDPNSLYVEATKRARDFAVECSWAFAKKKADVKLDSGGKPKAKKGSKAVRTYEVYCDLVSKNATRKDIIAAFQDKEVMAPAAPHTKSGATTYYYNMKKKFEAENG